MGKGRFWLNDFTGFLLKADQGEQTSPSRWWQIRNLIRRTKVITY